MGFFASGIIHGSNERSRLEGARLKGILNALKSIVKLPESERVSFLGKIKRIDFPFSHDENHSQTIREIKEIITKQLFLECCDMTMKDAFEECPGYINATTNCGDPHAMIGNEGRYESVDAAMASNMENPNILNPAFNDCIQLRITNSDFLKGVLVKEVSPNSGVGLQEHLLLPASDNSENSDVKIENKDVRWGSLEENREDLNFLEHAGSVSRGSLVEADSESLSDLDEIYDSDLPRANIPVSGSRTLFLGLGLTALVLGSIFILASAPLAALTGLSAAIITGVGIGATVVSVIFFATRFYLRPEGGSSKAASGYSSSPHSPLSKSSQDLREIHRNVPGPGRPLSPGKAPAKSPASGGR